MERTASTQRPYAKQFDFQRATRSELLSICLRNAANSFRTFAMEGETRAAQGIAKGDTNTGPSFEAYVGNVILIYVHMKKAWRQNIKMFDLTNPSMDRVILLHQEMLEVLDTEGELMESKVPRTLID